MDRWKLQLAEHIDAAFQQLLQGVHAAVSDLVRDDVCRELCFQSTDDIDGERSALNLQIPARMLAEIICLMVSLCSEELFKTLPIVPYRTRSAHLACCIANVFEGPSSRVCRASCGGSLYLPRAF